MMKVAVDHKSDPELEVDLDLKVVAEVDMRKTDIIIENQILDTMQHLVNDLNQFHQRKDTRQTNKTRITPWTD